MHVQNIAQNSSILDEIDREATKARVDAHLQKSLPDISISLKTTQTFIKRSVYWSGSQTLLIFTIGLALPLVFDIRYITNECTKICGLRNLVSTEKHCLQLIHKK